MAIPIQLRRNGTAASTPSSLLHGEVALNYADGKIFWKDASNVIQSFTFQAYALSSHTHAASDITSGTLDAARIANDSITYAKLQNVSATDRLLGRSSAGAGDVEEVTCTSFGRSLIDDADAAAARTTLGVQPTASPAFTGAATITASSGIPLTLNGNSTALRIEEGSGETIDIYRSASDGLLYLDANQQTFSGFVFRTTPTGGSITSALMIGSSQRVTLYNQLLVTAGSGSAGSYKPGIAVSGDDDTGVQQVGGAGTISIVTNGSERVRFGADGHLFLGNTALNPSIDNIVGVTLGPTGYVAASRSGLTPLFVNRIADDGTLVNLLQDGVSEGTISVSGNTVSYNAFCGSHWAQLIDGSRPAILRGTVLETIDEMCEWPDGKSDRLPRVKVSDTPASRRVYGVFMAWDEEYAATGDMYATALGAYMVRVSGTVQSGDLLESAGDGTARTQSDDIVRSSTIGKVSSTHRVEEYDDGSYLVPCVLMCG